MKLLFDLAKFTFIFYKGSLVRYLQMLKNISPKELKNKLEKENNLRLIDIREKWENEIAKLDNSELKPLSNFENEIKDLNKDDEIILYCHHGVRSLHAGNFLDSLGFNNVTHLVGGIDAYAKEVDNSIPEY